MSRSARFEVHESSDGQHYWLLRAKSGELTATGETHRSVSHACRAADKVQGSLQARSDQTSFGDWFLPAHSGFWKAGGPRKGLRKYAALRAWRPA